MNDVHRERVVFNTLEQDTYSQLSDIITDSVGAFFNSIIGDTLQYSNTFFPGELSETWAIDGLRKDEFTMIAELSSTSMFTKGKQDTTVEITNSKFTGRTQIEMRPIK